MATTSTKASASTEELLSSWRPQVFINFRGADLRDGFMSFLTSALDENNINYYIDSDEPRGADLSVLFERIRQSQIALVFFSNLYAESEWCLDELVEIMKNVEKGTLRVIPVFFKVKPEDVKGQKKEFGVALYGEGRRRRPRMSQWEDALESIPTKMGLVLAEGQSSEAAFLVKLIKNVKEVDAIILSERRARESSYEKIFRQSFEKVRKEKLLKSFVCSLSTSAGPVMGVLHITSVKLAYCSDNPLSYEKDGQTEWTYYKVAIPLHQLKAVNPITSIVNPGEKYIEVILVDDKEFWFMDFLYYESAVSSLKDSLQAGALR